MLHNIFKDAYVRKDDPVFMAVKMMLEKNTDFIPVLDDGKFIGILSRKDLQIVNENIEKLKLPCENFMISEQNYLKLEELNSLNIESFISFVRNDSHKYKVICEGEGKFYGLVKNSDLFRHVIVNSININDDARTSFGLIAWNKENELVYVNEAIREIININVHEPLSHFWKKISKIGQNINLLTNSIYMKHNGINIGIICFYETDKQLITRILSHDNDSEHQDLVNVIRLT